MSGVTITLTVKNERRLLRDNLLYHHALGVDRALVYDDGSTDGTVESIADLPFVTVRPTVAQSRFADEPGLEMWTANYDHHVSRQSLNLFDALRTSVARHDDWLLSLDADELVCTDPAQMSHGSLADLLDDVDPNIEAVLFPVAEVVQDRVRFRDVFAEATEFKVLTDDDPTRTYLDPYTRHRHDFRNHFHGHMIGKSAVRPAPHIRPGPHTHVFADASGRELRWAARTRLLHYHCFDLPRFLDVHRGLRRSSDRWPDGNLVDHQKRLWRDLVNDPAFGREDLRDYFARWVRVSAEEAARWRERPQPAIESFPSVAAMMASIDGRLATTG